jgi:FdhD protein
MDTTNLLIPDDSLAAAASSGVAAVDVQKVTGQVFHTQSDLLAIEEPLEIRIGLDAAGGFTSKIISITMRTPGHDAELAAGFLFSEGILSLPTQISKIHHRTRLGSENGNVIQVDVHQDIPLDLSKLERHFYMTSSCGVCGKASIAALQLGRDAASRESSPPAPAKGKPIFPASTIHRLPDTLRSAQAVFDQTGGLHAAALFDETGTLLGLREDVGRHNAVDKLIGSAFLAGRTPLSTKLLFVSGRASFELMQKTVMAGIPILAAVGAPSSLAVELAEEFDVTLLGFVRSGRFNIYSGEWRISQN